MLGFVLDFASFEEDMVGVGAMAFKGRERSRLRAQPLWCA
jgi:hypothetical protein